MSEGEQNAVLMEQDAALLQTQNVLLVEQNAGLRAQNAALLQQSRLQAAQQRGQQLLTHSWPAAQGDMLERGFQASAKAVLHHRASTELNPA